MIEKSLISNGVVLPMYNERFRFELKNLSELSELLNGFGHILIVDDGSQDNFASDVFEYIGSNQLKNVSILRLPLNLGKANAVKAGFKELIGKFPYLQYLSFADSDFSAPPTK